MDRVASPTWTLRAFALWQLPTAVFDLVLVVVIAILRHPDDDVVLPTIALLLVVLASTVAALAPWESLPPRWVMAVPVVDLVAAALINVYGHDLFAAVLAGALPAGWLSFVFDLRGLLTATLATVAVTFAPLVVFDDYPRFEQRTVEHVVPPVVVIGICTVTYLLSRILAHTQDALIRYSGDLAIQLITMDSILDAVDVAVSVHRPGLEPVRNRRAVEILHRASAAPEGRPQTTDLLFQADRVTPLDADQHVLARALSGETFHGVLVWVGTPGDQLAMMFSSRQMTDDDGERVGTVVVAYDATDLLSAIASRESFLANVSHELRTPLTSIVGNLELLQDELSALDGDTGRAEHMREVMERNSAVLLSRIEQVLAADDEQALDPQVVDLATLVTTSLAKHRVLADTAGIRLEVRSTPGLTARVDPMALEQVIDNLVSNAVKYTEAGSVTVVVEGLVGGFALQVVDTGIGMSDPELRNAFDRYFRADAAVRRAIPGIGLGLAITRRLVDLHGGTIEMSSVPGEGTTVTVRIPG